MNSYFPVILFQQLPIILLTWFPNIFMLDKTKFKNNIFKKEAWYFIEKKNPLNYAQPLSDSGYLHRVDSSRKFFLARLTFSGIVKYQILCHLY